MTRLLLRWSWRDLRSHWAKVVAIALVIAIGTGGYAGLTATAEWRRASYDINYRQLEMYDLRVDLATGGMIDQGDLAAIISALPDPGVVRAFEERLIVPTQVDASSDNETVLVRSEITGADFSGAGPQVNGYHAFTGRLLDEGDAGRPIVMVERNFAKFYELPATGEIAISGDRAVEYVAQATTPEYFTVAPEGEMFMSEATFGALFTTLETAQELSGHDGRVNNLILTLAEGADRDAVAAQLTTALEVLPVGTQVLTRDDNLSYTALTTDVDQDQAMFNALAVLLFAGAVGAAFNLIHRLAEQQRREIGIGMALGVSPRTLAIRPLLVSGQIAFLGVAFGVGVGMLIGSAMGGVLEDFIPLPVWETPFQTGVFARVAVIGLVLPFLASAIPVRRAVRVTPVDAIKPAHLTGGRRMRHRGGLAGNTFSVMPFRNLRRAPRRTAMTVLGIGAAITVLVGFLGIMDSVFDAVDTAEEQAVGDEPDRIALRLDDFYLSDSPAVDVVEQASTVGAVEPTLRLAATLHGASEEIDAFVELADLRQGMWKPSVVSGEIDTRPGLILSEGAARDLGVAVGDDVLLRHPRREGLASYTFVESRLPLLATHPHPIRALVYVDLSHAGIFNLEGITNALNILPATGADVDQVKRELFELDWVSSVQSVTAVTDAVRDAFDQMLGIIQIMVTAVLFLALLIAFNTAAINLDARAREHATMFAFGVKVRTALRVAVTESFVIGALGTMIGIAGGLAMVWWMTQSLLARTLPDFTLEVVLRNVTVVTVIALGVLAVTAAPLLTLRRMRKMNIPGTLRLVE